MRRAGLISIALLAIAAGRAAAHEIRPAYLELRAAGGGRFDVVWKVPTLGEGRLRLDPTFPPGCEPATPITTRAVPGAVVERWILACDGSLVGRRVGVAGLEATLTDVLLRLELPSTPAQVARLTPSQPSLEIKAQPSRSEVAWTYLRLGVEHILGGIDHLLFVLALLLIVSGWRRLLSTVTAFTVAHSFTLALAVLGFVAVPQRPVEAVIALSILFLASEIARQPMAVAAAEPLGLTERYPWIVAFTFGLLHGFGFAGALTEVGLPAADIPIALLFFNLGVETGQLAFVFTFLAARWLLDRIDFRWPQWARQLPAYGIGTMAAYWTVQRIIGFWSP